MKNKVTVFSLLLISLTSCTVFERKMIKDDLQGITKDNIKQIEGKYNAGGCQHINRARTKSDETQGITNMLSRSNASFQSRIGFTQNNHLLIQDYYDNSGAVVFIFWQDIPLITLKSIKEFNNPKIRSDEKTAVYSNCD